MKGSKPSWGPQYPSLAQRATKFGWDGKGSLWGLIAFVGIPQVFRDKHPCGGPSRDKDIELTCDAIAYRLDICEHVWEQGRNQRGLIHPALRRFRYWLARLIAPKD